MRMPDVSWTMGNTESEQTVNSDEKPWDGVTERRAATPQFALNSWPAVQSFVVLIASMVAGIAWGLKLESKIDFLQQNFIDKQANITLELRAINDKLAKGILPITELKVNQLEGDLADLKHKVEKLHGDK